jgi:hypothetical protein
VFNVLGESAYRDVQRVNGKWTSIPNPCSAAELEAWVREYFAYMDRHGAFVFSSAQSAPVDEEFRANRERMQMRSSWLLGVNLANRQRQPTEAPEALGLAMMAMLDLSWFHSRARRLPVDDDDMIRTVAKIMGATLVLREEN